MYFLARLTLHILLLFALPGMISSQNYLLKIHAAGGGG
jgi:hypothetical protein